jgi:hypothetical protein
MVGGQEVGTIKIELDMAIGETSAIESTDKGTMEDLVGKVRDLNGRVGDIRRELVFQRVCIIKPNSERALRTRLMKTYRSAKQSSVISPSRRMQRLYGIRLFS